MNDIAIAPIEGEGFVKLSRTRSGTLYKKHILSVGPLLYPDVVGGKVNITKDFLRTLKSNFESKVCDIVQTPMAGPNNEHSEAPERNIGEVVDLSIEGDKLYAMMDIRKHEEDVGKTLLGASAMFSLNYRNTSTGKLAGPTLLHVAITNRPYCLNLEDYEVIAASADSSDKAVMLTAPLKEISMDLDELIASLRDDHGIDVPKLQQKVSDLEGAVALSNANNVVTKIIDSGVIKLSAGSEATADDVLAAVTDLAAENVKLSNDLTAEREASRKTAAEHRVDGLIEEGKILAKNRDDQIELYLSNSELFERLVPENAVVRLSNEVGSEIPGEETDAQVAASEIERLASVAATQGYIRQG